MRPVVAVLIGVLVVVAAVPVAAGEENSPPLADAGLDQRVMVDETVLLDESGSRNQDGRLVAVEWRIETPNGTMRTPACADCPRTWFAPDRPGVYEVTFAVTGEGGAQRTDHLRVVEANSRPEVTVSGPSQVQPEEEATYAANVANENPLQTVVGTADGREFARTKLSGTRAATDASIVFESAGRDIVQATVYDVDGGAGVDSVETSISVARSRQRDAGGNGGSGCGTAASAAGPRAEVRTQTRTGRPASSRRRPTTRRWTSTSASRRGAASGRTRRTTRSRPPSRTTAGSSRPPRKWP